MSKIIVQVVLELALIGSEIALGKRIDIEEIFTSEKIIYNLVVLCAVNLAVEASTESDMVVHIPFCIDC